MAHGLWILVLICSNRQIFSKYTTKNHIQYISNEHLVFGADMFLREKMLRMKHFLH